MLTQPANMTVRRYMYQMSVEEKQRAQFAREHHCMMCGQVTPGADVSRHPCGSCGSALTLRGLSVAIEQRSEQC